MSGWDLDKCSKPSGAAMIHKNLIIRPPLALILFMASTAEPPVASIGSTTSMVRSSIGLGNLQ